ncbi:MAG: hypothetical protein H0T73_03945 [Ardenticatenales bacterium]|nr:hypothetical protein [Ardenticatenales bacterium]
MPRSPDGSTEDQSKTTSPSLLDTAPYPAIRAQHLITTSPSTPPTELADELENLLIATWREMAQDPDLLPWVKVQLEEYRVIMGYPPGWEGTSPDELSAT